MQKFFKEGANVGYLKKRWGGGGGGQGRSCKQRQGKHWKTTFKNYFGNLRGRD